MEQQYGAGPARQASAHRPRPLHDVLQAIYHMRPHTVFILFWSSLGLGMVADQVRTEWVVELFAVFWGVTVVAMLILGVRLMAERSARGGGRRGGLAHG